MRNLNHIDLLTVTHDEKDFFVELGSRIARYRQEMNLSQQRLGELLDISQQTVAHYETARLRVPTSLLPRLAAVFGVSVDTLLGVASKSGKRGPTSQLQRHVERISQLPKPKQRFVIEMLETVLAQASR